MKLGNMIIFFSLDKKVVQNLITIKMEENSKSNLHFDDFTFINRLGLTALGIWPVKKEAETSSQHLLKKINHSILFSFLIILLVPQWLDMYVLWGDMDAFAETFVLNVFTLTATFKLVFFISAQETFKVCKSELILLVYDLKIFCLLL